MKEDQIIMWFQNYFDKPSLKGKPLKPVLYFSLLWNLFEYTYFADEKKERLNPVTLLDLSEISFESINDAVLEKIYSHFRRRYLTNGETNMKFEDLDLSTCIKNQKEVSNYDYCKSVLINDSSSKLERTNALFLIIHRFRNNLFHGRKNPLTLNLFENEFRKINSFLTHFIEETSKQDSINKQRFSTIKE